MLQYNLYLFQGTKSYVKKRFDYATLRNDLRMCLDRFERSVDYIGGENPKRRE